MNNKEVYILFYNEEQNEGVKHFIFNTKEDLENFCNDNPDYFFDKIYKGKELNLKLTIEE